MNGERWSVRKKFKLSFQALLEQKLKSTCWVSIHIFVSPVIVCFVSFLKTSSFQFFSFNMNQQLQSAPGGWITGCAPFDTRQTRWVGAVAGLIWSAGGFNVSVTYLMCQLLRKDKLDILCSPFKKNRLYLFPAQHLIQPVHHPAGCKGTHPAPVPHCPGYKPWADMLLPRCESHRHAELFWRISRRSVMS